MEDKALVQLRYEPIDLDKRAKAFGLRCFLANFVYFIPAAAAFGYVVWYFHRKGEFSLRAIAVFLACILAGIIINTIMLRQFRCPNCRIRIRRPVNRAQSKIAIKYLCPECGTEWDTGLRWHSDE